MPAFLGMSLPVGSDPQLMGVEQGYFAHSAPVTLERIVVTAWGASVEEPQGLLAAHGHLLAARLAPARASYEALLKNIDVDGGVRRAARWYRGFARGRLGDAAAASDLVLSATQDPFRALLLLEDLAEGLPTGNRADAKTVTTALRRLRDGDDELLAAIARSLAGDYTATHTGRVKGRSRQKAQDYLHMRAARRRDRNKAHARYRKLAPNARLPRTVFPLVLGVLDAPPDDVAYKRLLTLTNDPYQNYVNACRAWFARPLDPTPPFNLGYTYKQQRRLGEAARLLRRVNLDEVPREQRQVVLSSLGECYYSIRRPTLLLAVLKKLLEAGMAPKGLDVFKPLYGNDPRFKALTEEAKR
jgi:hypothetical protein